jgi:putative sulfotransferase
VALSRRVCHDSGRVAGLHGAGVSQRWAGIYRENGSLCERSKSEMTADARTAWPGVIVVSTGRCGSTMLSNMLRLNPEILSLSEFFSLLMPDPFPAGELDAAAYWRLLSEPWVFFRHVYRLGLRVPEFLYVPGPGSRFTAATGIPPVLVTALPHLSENPDGLYDEVQAFAAGLTPASAAAQHRRLIGWLCDRLGARLGRALGQLAAVCEPARRPVSRRQVVHLYRDGRECAYSFSRHPAYRLGAVSAMLDSRLGMSPYLDDDKPPEQVPPDLRPFMPETFDHEAFERFDVSVAESGQFWSDMIIPALDVLASLPAERVFQVSYENLVAEPRQALLRLARFAGLPDTHRGWLDRAVQLVEPRPPRWTALPQEQISDLTRVCNPAMQRLYGHSW